jgi:selenocysteine lyase/cysteine desulfurase
MKAHFSRFLTTVPGRLHFAAHSHHPWPDVTFEAQQEAWLDAARLMDAKWDRIFGEVIPEAQGHIARRLGLPDPTTVTFAPNTHALVIRLLSTLTDPIRILTTDAEFHSFARQARRLEEDGRAVVERVAVEPFAGFPERFAETAARGGYDLVHFSHVLFSSAYVVPDLAALVQAVPDPSTLVVIDGYHGFMAVPTDLSVIAGRAFYTAGGYKYAMAGEGAGFMHCPPGYAARPPDTGWFATFGDLTAAARPGDVPYPADGARFLGGTFDPTGLYRLNAAQRWLDGMSISVSDIHGRVAALQRTFLATDHAGLPRDALVPAAEDVADRGHFLTYQLPGAGAVHRRLLAAGVVTDFRGDRLRLGFGLYHDEADLEELDRRLASPMPAAELEVL